MQKRSMQKIWNNDQSKLKFLEAEILKLKNENASFKGDNKSKVKMIESLTTCQRSCTILNNKKLHVKTHSCQNTHTRNSRETRNALLTYSVMPKILN